MNKPKQQSTARFARTLAAMGTEPRLNIMPLLLTAHPERNEGLVNVHRVGTFLRYTANTAGLEGLLGFLYAECCTRNKAVRPKRILCCS